MNRSPKILFIDAFDSFSNSIIALLQTELPITVECIKINDPRFVLNDDVFYKYLDAFDAVVAGPGPGHPANPRDVGLTGKLWTLPEDHLLPVMGICLGFQSLCLAFGAKVERLKEPRHGIMSMITHCSKDIFTGTGKIVATQYHSLQVNLERPGIGDEWGAWDLWKPSDKCEHIIPLAWSLMNVVNGPTLMGARHDEKPFWGVQYHPESICTNHEGRMLIRKWWEEACKWRGRVDSGMPTPVVEEAEYLHTESPGNDERASRKVKWKKWETGGDLDLASVVDLLRRKNPSNEPLVLESGLRCGKPVNSETGRYSIIGLPDKSSTQLRYSVIDRCLHVRCETGPVLQEKMTIDQAFAYMEDFIRSNRAVDGPAQLPFWGGLIGFISYEAGLASIDVTPAGAKAEHPDIWFEFVERSIVVDHVEGVLYAQSLRENDDEWVNSISALAPQFRDDVSGKEAQFVKIDPEFVSGPENAAYRQKVIDCQSKLRAGESYELCLTDQTIIRTKADPWTLYRQLRSSNPAPFGAFLRLDCEGSPGLSLAGSSPERFLSWSRSDLCQFRPIKGTVKKVSGVTRAKAEEILGSAKERAENLMIVDLIRHDLAGVPGVQEVRVPKLMSVEEYETVFQLVSVIEGDAASGIAALAASLPPGSMTGAPKKRSCELLQDIEGRAPRGLYSGVVGYLDVGGGGDFSVVIRTAFKWDDQGDDWHVGAGGAITTLSEAESEWEEMVTKRESVLNALL